MSAMTMENLQDIEARLRSGGVYYSWGDEEITVSYNVSDDQFVVVGVVTKRFARFDDALFCLLISLGTVYGGDA
jgi:hypothetical protein